MNILATSLPRLKQEIEKLNRKFIKSGLSPVVLKIGEPFKEFVENPTLGLRTPVCYYPVTIEGGPPELDGWQLIATVQPTPEGNLIREVPGEICPTQFRSGDMYCDHCKSLRKRSKVYILRKENQYVQVGRTCLAEFLGDNFEYLLKRESQLGSILSLFGKAGQKGWSPLVSTLDFVTVVYAIKRKLGYVSRKTASEKGVGSTADIAWNVIMGREKLEFPIKPSDIEIANFALDWAAKLVNPESNYLHDLSVCCRLPWLEYDKIGYAASVIPAFEKVHRPQVVRQSSNYVGKVGERINLENLTAKLLREYETTYGIRSLVKFVDFQGNLFIWRTGKIPSWLKLDETYNVRATVKAHTLYCEQAETVLERVIMSDSVVTT